MCVATCRLHCNSYDKTRQRARYAAMSHKLSALSQMPDIFLSADHQNYQAVIAENVSELRA